MELKSLNSWIQGKQDNFLIISGPCSAETRDQVLETAGQIAETGKVQVFRSGVWKPRTRPNAFEGIGSFKLENADKIISHDININDLIKKSKKLPLKTKRETYTVVASRSHLTNETKEFIEQLKDKHKKIELVSRGSSLKLCMIAEGSADIYPRFAPTMEWDTAAGQAIVEIAGGKVLNKNQKDRIRYNKKDLLNPWFIVK